MNGRAVLSGVIGDMTLVEETRRRTIALELAKERTLFLLNRLHQPYDSEILGDTPAEQSHRAAAQHRHGACPVLYSVLKIAAADPQAVVALFPSDHYISDNRKFMNHIRTAFETARVRRDMVILLGIEPESPERNTAGSNLRTQFRPQRVAPSPTFLGKALFRVGCQFLQLRGCLWNSFVMVASATR